MQKECCSSCHFLELPFLVLCLAYGSYIFLFYFLNSHQHQEHCHYGHAAPCTLSQVREKASIDFLEARSKGNGGAITPTLPPHLIVFIF